MRARVHVHVHVRVRVRVGMGVRVRVRMHVRVRVHVCVRAYACATVWLHFCVLICVFQCKRVCRHVRVRREHMHVFVPRSKQVSRSECFHNF